MKTNKLLSLKQDLFLKKNYFSYCNFNHKYWLIIEMLFKVTGQTSDRKWCKITWTTNIKSHTLY